MTNKQQLKTEDADGQAKDHNVGAVGLKAVETLGIRIPSLDGIRAIAILAVLAHHGLNNRAGGGWLGVNLFFVLSGFLITYLLVREEHETGTISLPGFWKRRALRILPPIPIAIALALLAGTSVAAIPPVVLFYANFVDRHSLGGLEHLWSLAIEEHFYLFWPLAFIGLTGNRKRLLWTIVIISPILRVLAYSGGMDLHTIPRLTPLHLDSIAVGCLAAMYGLHQEPPLRRLALPALLAICYCFALAVGGPFVTTVGLSIFAALCVPVVCGSSGNRFLEHPVMRYIGTRSYGLYLYHYPIFFWAHRFLEPRNPLNFLVVRTMTIVLTMLVVEASYQTIERLAREFRSKQRIHPPAIAVE